MTNSFGSELAGRIAENGPLCVGIDPGPEVLAKWSAPDGPAGLESFMADLLEVLPSEVAAVKPQAAFFERFGARGWQVLEESVAELRRRGFLVILDAKRGDIGSSMAGYANAYFGDGPLQVDALTASPYLGVGSLAPLLDLAKERGRGVFVLCRTSNPEGRTIQDQRSDGEEPLWRRVQDAVGAWNDGDDPGSMGVVLGATVDGGSDSFGLHGGPILAPGFGWQGATAQDFGRLFGPVADRTLASYSRSLLMEGKSAFATTVRAEAERLRSQVER